MWNVWRGACRAWVEPRIPKFGEKLALLSVSHASINGGTGARTAGRFHPPGSIAAVVHAAARLCASVADVGILHQLVVVIKHQRCGTTSGGSGLSRSFTRGGRGRCARTFGQATGPGTVRIGPVRLKERVVHGLAKADNVVIMVVADHWNDLGHSTRATAPSELDALRGRLGLRVC